MRSEAAALDPAGNRGIGSCARNIGDRCSGGPAEWTIRGRALLDSIGEIAIEVSHCARFAGLGVEEYRTISRCRFRQDVDGGCGTVFVDGFEDLGGAAGA